MNNIIASVLLLFAVLYPAYAAGEEEAQSDEEAISGRELLEGCAEGAAPGNPNQYCMRYVFGLIQVVDMLQQSDPSQKVFCIDPNQVSLQEVTERTVNWLKQKPERLDEDAYKLVTESLHGNYPCEGQKI